MVSERKRDRETVLLVALSTFSILLLFTTLSLGAGLFFDVGFRLSESHSTADSTADSLNNNSFESDSDPSIFAEVADERGLQYEYVQNEETAGMMSVTTNAGVYISDVNNNGRDDVLAIGGDEPVLFENVGGELLPSETLPEIDTSANGALFFDHNNDGWDDLLLLPPNSTPIFLKNQEGMLERQSDAFDIQLENPTGATVADITGNGCLDLFIVQNGDWEANRPQGTKERGVGTDDNGNPNYLFYGDCNSFERAENVGIEGERWTLAATAVDFTGNDYPDIYVANDFNNDRLHMNRGDGTFESVEIPDSDRNAMSAAVADFTGDGSFDVFVTNIYYGDHIEDLMPVTRMTASRAVGNNLFVNNGNGSFVDQGAEFGVRAGGWGWAAAISDYNNDGNRSIIHTTSPLGVDQLLLDRYNGNERAMYRNHPYLQYPMVFDRSDHESFDMVHPPDRGFEPGAGRGIAQFDLNGDGSLDFVVADTRSPYKLYENQGKNGNWLRVDIEGDGEHTTLGTKVSIETNERTRYQVKHSNTDFLSQKPRTLHFGVGHTETVDLTVNRPDGTTQHFSDLPVNTHIVVTPDGELRTREP